jgi:hypothetical protein
MNPGIRTSWDHKKHLKLLNRDSNETNLIWHYKQYCKILGNVIKEAKRSLNNNQVISVKKCNLKCYKN